MDISQDAGGGNYDTRSISYADLLAQIQNDIVFPNNYLRAELLINSIPSTLPASLSDQFVTGLEYTITQDGDYVIYATCNAEIDNADIKPLSIVLYHEPLSTGTPVVLSNSRSQEYSKKNEFQSVQTTYAKQSLLIGDKIAVYLNNNNEADILAVSVGRLLIQKFD